MNKATNRPKVVQLSLFRDLPGDETGLIDKPAFFRSKTEDGFNIENLLSKILFFGFDERGRLCYLPDGWRIRKSEDGMTFRLIDKFGIVRGEGNDILDTQHRTIRFKEEFLKGLANEFTACHSKSGNNVTHHRVTLFRRKLFEGSGG